MGLSRECSHRVGLPEHSRVPGRLSDPAVCHHDTPHCQPGRCVHLTISKATTRAACTSDVPFIGNPPGHLHDGGCAGEAISLRIWAGCVAALAGGVLMTLSHSGSDAAGAFSGLAAGDGLLIGAALLWSIQVRTLARVVQPLLHATWNMNHLGRHLLDGIRTDGTQITRNI
jgi:hypothetical protein